MSTVTIFSLIFPCKKASHTLDFHQMFLTNALGGEHVGWRPFQEPSTSNRALALPSNLGPWKHLNWAEFYKSRCHFVFMQTSNVVLWGLEIPTPIFHSSLWLNCMRIWMAPAWCSAEWQFFRISLFQCGLHTFYHHQGKLCYSRSRHLSQSGFSFNCDLWDLCWESQVDRSIGSWDTLGKPRRDCGM